MATAAHLFAELDRLRLRLIQHFTELHVMAEYLLQPHVHACITTEAAILLDLREDQYIGLDRTQARALACVLDGAEGFSLTTHTTVVSEAEAVSFAEQLVKKQLLTHDRNAGKSASMPNVPTAELSLTESAATERRAPAMRPHHVLNFLRSYAFARFALRHSSLDRVVSRLKARRQQHRAVGQYHLETIADLMIIFRRVRLFVYTPKNRCLLDSLVLIEFLAHYSNFPQFVLGVRIEPFAAHAWVQHDAYVLNGNPDYIRRFTPIVAV